MLTEITNTICKRVWPREINLKTAQEALHTVLRFGIEVREEVGLHAPVLELARDLKLTTTYDAHYLALAEQQGCYLRTGDKKLYHAVHKKLPRVRWVGHLAPLII